MAKQKKLVGKRILLIDHDPGARDSIKLLLTSDRHEVVEATGGAQCGGGSSGSAGPAKSSQPGPEANKPVSGQTMTLSVGRMRFSLPTGPVIRKETGGDAPGLV